MNARLFICNFKPLDPRTIITQEHLCLCALLLLIVERCTRDSGVVLWHWLRVLWFTLSRSHKALQERGGSCSAEPLFAWAGGKWALWLGLSWIVEWHQQVKVEYYPPKAALALTFQMGIAPWPCCAPHTSVYSLCSSLKHKTDSISLCLFQLHWFHRAAPETIWMCFCSRSLW